MEYEYRITGVAAKKAVSDATNATKTLKTLTRRSAKITAKPKLVSKTKVPRASSMPSLLLAELAERQEEKSLTIQSCLASYARFTRAILIVTSSPTHGTVPMGEVLQMLASLILPPTCSQSTDGQHPRNLDVNMTKSTNSFGNTMCMDDLAGGAVNPPLLC